MNPRLLDAGTSFLRERDYEVSRPESGAEPPGLATPRSDADSPFGPARTTAVDPVDDADPTTILSRLWTNRERDRATLFVVRARDTADAVADLLAPPLGVVSADEAGRRTFFDGPDRVALAEGGYAAIPAGDDVSWYESGGGGRSESLPEQGRRPADRADQERDEGDRFQLELRTDDEILAVLDGVDELDHPPRAAFPYNYERDDDKRIRVRDFQGRPVETFGGVAAMREGGFAPVAAPLVPEHMFDGDIDGWWGVLVVADDTLVTGRVGSAER